MGLLSDYVDLLTKCWARKLLDIMEACILQEIFCD